ncbi:hypothetical protein ACPFP2_27725 [Micromonospora citrea]|uniref:hypothetical protein n=1 Tax=Micromonospora citrea TaxID=47855 RepID=UPI003C3699FF
MSVGDAVAAGGVVTRGGAGVASCRAGLASVGVAAVGVGCGVGGVALPGVAFREVALFPVVARVAVACLAAGAAFLTGALFFRTGVVDFAGADSRFAGVVTPPPVPAPGSSAVVAVPGSPAVVDVAAFGAVTPVVPGCAVATLSAGRVAVPSGWAVGASSG